MSAVVLRGDARALPLPDASVDLIVTSPPYYALRSYSDSMECARCYQYRLDGRDLRQAWPDYGAHVRTEHKPSHYQGQIGSERTPAEYIANLVACTREWMRVLKPAGSLFVDLGDKYAQTTERSRNGHGGALDGGLPLRGEVNYAGRRDNGVPTKSLMLLPERYRIACVDQLGLIARAVIVWSKPNGLPESVTDRVRRSHEDWVHLTKQPRYFSAVDNIRQPQKPLGERHEGRSFWREHHPSKERTSGNGRRELDPLGALPGSVWEIPTEPLTVPDHLGIDHFAAYPTEWPRRIILGWSPSGICTACGEGRRPVTEADGQTQRQRLVEAGGTARHAGAGRQGLDFKGGHHVWRTFAVTGEACACPDTAAPTRPAVVVDPFGGTGTTALVAAALGRTGITVDRSADYCRLAAWRTTDPGQVAKAMRVDKPPIQADGQGDLLAALLTSEGDSA